MKKIRIFYWIVTILFAGLMIFSGIANALSLPAGVELFRKINLPAYLLPFLGIAKLLGGIAILIPRFPRLKEWAYAGLIYDLLGAIYCNYSAGATPMEWSPILLFVALGFASYFLYHKKIALERG